MKTIVLEIEIEVENDTDAELIRQTVKNTLSLSDDYDDVHGQTVKFIGIHSKDHDYGYF